jgi:hypothetical protein
MISRQISLRLEKSGARIQTTQQQQQRRDQPYAAEQGDSLQGGDVTLRYGSTGNNFCDSSHLRLQSPASSREADYAGVAEPA